MRELSLYLSDIIENSIEAKAKNIEVSVVQKENTLTLTVTDDGVGMTEDFLKKVTDPFVTTRTERKVGMGIPLFKGAALLSGGDFSIVSEKFVGTTVCASFMIDNVNRPPLGNIADSVVMAIGSTENIDFIFNFDLFDQLFTVDTRMIKQELSGIPVNSPEVLTFLRKMINKNLKTKTRGVSL